MLKNYLFFGYTKQSVEDELDKLNDRIRSLTDELNRKDQRLEDLNEELRRAKSEEALIQEAIIDAKALSKRLIQEAQEQAQLLMTYVEEDVNKQLDYISEEIKSLKKNKTSMLSQEAAARHQLKESLNHYLSLIDEQSTTLTVQNNILEVDFKQAEDQLQKTRSILNKTSAEQKKAFEAVEDNILQLKRAEA